MKLASLWQMAYCQAKTQWAQMLNSRMCAQSAPGFIDVNNVVLTCTLPLKRACMQVACRRHFMRMLDV